MRAEIDAMPVTAATLSMELRAALDLLFELLAGEQGVMQTRAIGDPTLVAALAAYGTLESDHDHLTFLGTSQAEIGEHVGRHQPRHLTVLGASRIQGVVRPFRSGTRVIARVPANDWWAHRGYRLLKAIKIQGIGSLFWSSCDRFLRRVDRPHLADRCRVAMLRTLVAARWRFVPGTLLIQDYRRAT